MNTRAATGNELILNARGAEVVIRPFCTPEEIGHYSYESHFGTHARYRSLYTHKTSLETIAAQPDTNITLAIAADQHIVGVGVLTHPDADERWAELGAGVMMEVKGLEVAREWRAAGIASSLIRMLLTHKRTENMITYMVGYSWTWDLDGTGKSAQEYRQTMIQLFEPYGFQEFQTNEPNICLKPENLFMARIGRHVSRSIQHRFKWLCFGVAP